MRLVEQVEEQVGRRVRIGRDPVLKEQTNCFAAPAIGDVAYEFPRSPQVSLFDRHKGVRNQPPKPGIPSEHRPHNTFYCARVRAGVPSPVPPAPPNPAVCRNVRVRPRLLAFAHAASPEKTSPAASARGVSRRDMGAERAGLLGIGGGPRRRQIWAMDRPIRVGASGRGLDKYERG